MIVETPKIIWIFWYQGIQEAPNIVKTCILSWKLHHLDYDLKILNEKTIHDHITIPNFITIKRKDFNYQEYANFVRLALLKKYGGIWVDANIYCFQSLDNWLPALLNENVFLLQSNFGDRLNVNWFIAATPNHYLINEWKKNYDDFFEENYFRIDNTFIKNKLTKTISKFIGINSERTKWWFSFFVRKVLNVYPYFIMHYMFNRLYYHDGPTKSIWDNVPKVSACNFDMRCQRMNNISFGKFYSKYKKDKIYLLKLTHRITSHWGYYEKYINLINEDFRQLQKKDKLDGRGG